jgi:hypothetical protein
VFERDREATCPLAHDELLVACLEDATLDLPGLALTGEDEPDRAAQVSTILPRETKGSIETRGGNHKLIGPFEQTALFDGLADAAAQFREQVGGDPFFRIHEHLEDLPSCKWTERELHQMRTGGFDEGFDMGLQ